MTKKIDKFDDVIDSRDVIERIEYLSGGLADGPEDMTSDEIEELASLKRLAELLETESEWVYGLQLIRDTYFQTYAEELAEDSGMIPEKASWPAYCIDWEYAARELKHDYSCVEWEGVDYWYRS